MRKYDNFIAALENLNDIYKYEEPFDNVVLTGLVGLFDICFEQSWKAMKEILTEQGFPEAKTGSPRQVLKTAFTAGMIKDEQLWLSALNTRNHVAHAYNRMIALEIIRQTKEQYYDMFCGLKAEIDQNW